MDESITSFTIFKQIYADTHDLVAAAAASKKYIENRYAALEILLQWLTVYDEYVFYSSNAGICEELIMMKKLVVACMKDEKLSLRAIQLHHCIEKYRLNSQHMPEHFYTLLNNKTQNLSFSESYLQLLNNLAVIPCKWSGRSAYYYKNQYLFANGVLTIFYFIDDESKAVLDNNDIIILVAIFDNYFNNIVNLSVSDSESLNEDFINYIYSTKWAFQHKSDLINAKALFEEIPKYLRDIFYGD